MHFWKMLNIFEQFGISFNQTLPDYTNGDRFFSYYKVVIFCVILKQNKMCSDKYSTSKILKQIFEVMLFGAVFLASVQQHDYSIRNSFSVQTEAQMLHEVSTGNTLTCLLLKPRYFGGNYTAPAGVLAPYVAKPSTT